MRGQTPAERAAKAIADPGVRGMCDKGCECEDDLVLTRWVARRALEAATRDVDELAEVLAAHQPGPRGECTCGWKHDWSTQEFWIDAYDKHVARAVVAHLTKGNENDE